jgi:hypothetical protein
VCPPFRSNAIHAEGDLLINSVHRFKGRASPCVVFTEIDFEVLDDAGEAGPCEGSFWVQRERQ